METRANYVLIGALTLGGIIAAFAFFLWYAKIAIDRQYDYFDIRFDQISGLSRAAEVRFNGILVGQVLSIDLSQTGSAVLVSIQVDEGIPINSSTVAQLGSQGVTGVSYISLTSARPDAPPLEPDPITGTLVIPSRPSAIESLIEGAPELLTEARDLLRELNALANADNRQRVSQILANVEQASSGLEQALTDFSAISGSVRDGVDQISAFTGQLEGIATQAETTLRTADTTLTSATGAFNEVQGTLSTATAALDSARVTLDSAETLLSEQGPALVGDYQRVAQALTATVDDVGGRAAALMEQLDTTVGLASARLREAEAPIAAAAPALTAVEGAASSVETLLAGDGAALVAEARSAMTTLNRILDQDAPAILADVRSATETVTRVVAEVGEDVTEFTSSLDGLGPEVAAALTDARQTFRTATDTLQALEPAIASAQGTLAAAESAFASADRVMNTDIEPILSEVSGAIAALNQAIAQVTEDLPRITGQALEAAAAAERGARQFETLMSSASPAVQSFAQTGLPQFTRLLSESRTLISTIEQLTQRIERDPARFFLGGQVPEYRR